MAHRQNAQQPIQRRRERRIDRQAAPEPRLRARIAAALGDAPEAVVADGRVGEREEEPLRRGVAMQRELAQRGVQHGHRARDERIVAARRGEKVGNGLGHAPFSCPRHAAREQQVAFQPSAPERVLLDARAGELEVVMIDGRADADDESHAHGERHGDDEPRHHPQRGDEAIEVPRRERGLIVQPAHAHQDRRQHQQQRRQPRAEGKVEEHGAAGHGGSIPLAVDSWQLAVGSWVFANVPRATACVQHARAAEVQRALSNCQLPTANCQPSA